MTSYIRNQTYIHNALSLLTAPKRIYFWQKTLGLRILSVLTWESTQ